MSFGFSRLDEAGRGGLQRRQLVLHAGAAVQQQRQRDRLLPAVEEGDVLLDAVLEHREIVLIEVGDVVVLLSRATVTFSDTMSTPARKAGCALCGHGRRVVQRPVRGHSECGREQAPLGVFTLAVSAVPRSGESAAISDTRAARRRVTTTLFDRGGMSDSGRP